MTTNLTLALAAVTLVAGIGASAETARPFTASPHYWAWIDSMEVAPVVPTPMPATADLSRTNPLHPAFFAKHDEGSWAATGAVTSAPSAVMRNPLHPQYQR